MIKFLTFFFTSDSPVTKGYIDRAVSKFRKKLGGHKKAENMRNKINRT